MLLDIKDKFPFGKYKGETVKEVIKSDPQYIYWIAENLAGVAFTTKAQDALPSKKSLIYEKAKRACSDMGGLGKILNSGPSGEYAQLSMDSEIFDFDDREDDCFC